MQWYLKMLLVIDDYFTQPVQKQIADDFLIHKKSGDMQWFDCTFDAISKDTAPLSSIINTASKLFDLSTMTGFEFWSNTSYLPGWHYDKDEGEFDLTGKNVFPLCSIVYYAHVKDLVSGRFVTETEKIVPKTNRLLIFSPGIYHTVEPFAGERIAIAINVWNYKPRKYI